MKPTFPAAFLIFFILNAQSVQSARILFYWAETSYSHRVAVWPLAEELSARGHNVTFLSPFPPKSPNSKVTEFHPKLLVEFMKQTIVEFDPIKFRSDGDSICDNILMEEGHGVCDAVLSSPDTKEWMQNSDGFDLIIIDGLLNECGLALAAHFKAPFIIYETSSIYLWHLEELGLPDESYWIPNERASSDMTFLQRLRNSYVNLHCHYVRAWDYLPKMEKLIKEKLQLPNFPPLAELQKNVSLVFVNSHYSYDYARSVSPMIIPVGGLHLSDVGLKLDALPENIQKFIDRPGKNGFIFVSFGTWIEVSTMPLETQKALMEALKSFPNIQFIWKWAGAKPTDIPDNVLLTDWAPQRALLAHPKIRAFVTHGGLLSTQESIHFGVPIICFPILGDQNYNAEQVRRLGFGVMLEILNITSTSLKNAISSILGNEEYVIQARKVASTFRDRPMQALETAVWWTEFVLRHKGETSFLRPKSINTNWFYRRSLDIWLFVIAMIALFLVVISISARCLLCLMTTQSSYKIKRS